MEKLDHDAMDRRRELRALGATEELIRLVQAIDGTERKQLLDKELMRMFVEIYNTWFITYMTEIRLVCRHGELDVYAFSVSDSLHPYKLQIVISIGEETRNQKDFDTIECRIEVEKKLNSKTAVEMYCSDVHTLITRIRSEEIDNFMKRSVESIYG